METFQNVSPKKTMLAEKFRKIFSTKSYVQIVYLDNKLYTANEEYFYFQK